MRVKGQAPISCRPSCRRKEPLHSDQRPGGVQRHRSTPIPREGRDDFRDNLSPSSIPVNGAFGLEVSDVEGRLDLLLRGSLRHDISCLGEVRLSLTTHNAKRSVKTSIVAANRHSFRSLTANGRTWS